MIHTVAYTEAHNYRTFRNWGYLPIVDVELFSGRQRALALALVDTGAAYPLFSRQFAEDLLGLDVTKMPVEKLTGVSGVAEFYKTRLRLRFGPIITPVECEVRFAEVVPVNLLGRSGAFNHVQIGVDEAARKIYMALNNTSTP